MSATARRLPDGRLHLHHGPIDLVVSAEGPAVAEAFDAAARCFDGLLDALVAELALLRAPVGAWPRGEVAQAMVRATLPHGAVFVTPMAAVAGAVADRVLAAMPLLRLTRASVNNGGDIAVHLAPDETCRIAILSPTGADLGTLTLRCGDDGVATSGLGGRSQTLGIADAVTVVAPSAAQADVAATLIANAVDLPDHPCVRRVPASDLHPDSDLGARLVTTAVGALRPAEIDAALTRGLACADDMRSRGLITAAALFLRGASRATGPAHAIPSRTQRTLHHA